MKNFRKGIAACIGVALATSILVGCVRSDTANDQVNLNDTDIQFVKAAAMSNFAELTLSKLDTTKSTDSAMKDFGMMMVTDHTAAGTQLKTLASAYGLTARDSLDTDHAALLANLMTLSGRSFDSTYIKNMVMDHTAAIALFENESTNGQQEQLRVFANTLLPTLQMHLDKATALSADY